MFSVLLLHYYSKQVIHYMALERTSLVDQLYSQLRKDIVSMKIPLGSKLVIRELQQQYGVSPTPVREALIRLQAEGLVNSENNMIAKVINLNVVDLQEIYALASVLNKAMLRASMSPEYREGFLQAYENCAEEIAHAQTDDDLARSIHHFDLVAYTHCHNSRFQRAYRTIDGPLRIIRHICHFHTEPNYPVCHRDMLLAAKRGDVEGMIQISDANLRYIIRNTAGYLQTKDSSRSNATAINL